MSKFDELFNDFMNDGANNKDESSDIMANLFKKLSNLNSFDKNGIMGELNESLGEPDEFKNFEENGVFFQKQIWNTKHGQVIKTVISDVPFKETKSITKKTRVPLEIQLETAVKEENYELAVKLRDRISKRNASKLKK
jgi:protein-arginine kinase activator protein McsA